MNINNDEYLYYKIDKNHFSKTNRPDEKYREPVMPVDYRKNATPGKGTNNKPYYPHTPDLPQKSQYPKKKYKSSRKLSSKKKNKLPRALSLLLAAGIIAGGIKVVTLGIDLSRDNSLAESQQNLAEMTNRETALEEMGVYEQKDNSLEILNSDLNNLLQKYKENPNSVSQEEVRNILGSCYLEGRNVVFSKMADAYNTYSQENDEYPKTVESENLIYRVSDGKDNMTPCYVAYRPDSINNPNGTALPSNNKLSNFISTQLKIKDLYSNENLLDVSKSIELLKEGITDINDFYTSNFNIEKGLLGGRKLIIEEKEKNNASIDYNEVEGSLYSYTGDKDTGDR